MYLFYVYEMGRILDISHHVRR